MQGRALHPSKQNQPQNKAQTKHSQKKMTYKEYTKNLKKAPIHFRDQVCKELGGMALSTFYKKISETSFTPGEKQAIAECIGIPADVLFPEEPGGEMETRGSAFREIYLEKKAAYRRCREEIRALLGNIALSAYYHKLDKNGLTQTEKEKIAKHLYRTAGELFPEKTG